MSEGSAAFEGAWSEISGFGFACLSLVDVRFFFVWMAYFRDSRVLGPPSRNLVTHDGPAGFVFVYLSGCS